MRTAALALLVCFVTGTAFADSAVANGQQQGVAGPDDTP